MITGKYAIVTSILTITLLAGCATPTVVQTRKASDGDLSCAQLKDQIREAEDFEVKARKERGMTGTNVAAVALFPLGLLGTYKNTEDAIEAAKERQKNLFAIAKGKSCPFAK